MANAFDRFDAPAEKSSNAFDRFDAAPKFTAGRAAGLTARNVVEGLAAIPATLMDIPASAYNLGADVIQGKGKGPRFNEMNQNIAAILDKAGLPRPETAGERTGSTIAQAVTGTGGLVKGAQLTQRAATPVIARVAEQLAARPKTQVAAAVTGGASASAAREADLPWWAQAGAGLAGGMAAFGVPPVARFGASAANRLASGATDGRVQLLNPATEAERRIRAAFLTDGGPEEAARKAASFAASGASTPSLLDIGGGTVRRLVRSAAGPGDEAHNIATAYADRVRADLQDNALAATHRLAPGVRPAEEVATQMEKDQGTLATEQYREPYSQPATVTKDMVSALQGPEGRGAINRAYVAARANRDSGLMAELKDLQEAAAEQGGGRDPLTGKVRSLQTALEGLSSEVLDRVRRAMRDTGMALQKNDKRDIARGYFGRVKDIDSALDQTPNLTEARATYRQMQQARDAVDIGKSVTTMPGDQYEAEVGRLAGVGGPPNIGAGLQPGAAQAIRDAIERPAAGQTGVLNRLSSGTGPGRNLAVTFGDAKTAQFREALANEVRRLRNANFISPESGSQTQLRLVDEALMGGVPTSAGGFVAKIAEKIMRKVELTPAERAEIVRLGTSEADLKRFIANLPQRPSRAAAFTAPITTANTSGRN